MSDKVMYWGAMILGGLALLIAISNVFLISGNRSLQVELSQRQATISSAGTLDQINRALIQALAQLSVEENDKDATELLTSQGLTVKKEKAGATSTTDEKKK